MTQKQIGSYYAGLTNGEKGRFTAYISVKLGSSPHTWQSKLLLWAKNSPLRPLSPLLKKELSAIIRAESWRNIY